MDSGPFDSKFTKNIQFVLGDELPAVAGHIAVEYRNCMIVWGGYVSFSRMFMLKLLINTLSVLHIWISIIEAIQLFIYLSL